ncbi:MAG TPA: SufBD protein [Sediminispirochaeta sp.]|nr:SufBD protein [Sediminispirochaeta sp.]
MSDKTALDRLLATINMHRHSFEEGTAHVEIHGNQVLNTVLVEGLHVESRETASGVDVNILVEAGARIDKPVYFCFGMLENGLQHIRMRVHFQEKAKARFISHCSFAAASEVEHLMDAEIQLDAGAEYSYFERHIHSEQGGIRVVPKAKVTLAEESRFATEFELIKGRVGEIDIDYEAYCGDHSVLELLSRISGRGDDRIKIREAGFLNGKYSRGVLTSHIAVRDSARAEIYNELQATAEGAAGHVDCNEIVQNQAQAKAIPIVDVRHPKAHVTHEAAIGSVDSKQLQTLMSRGLSEEEAVEMIIQGLLRK